VRLDAAGLDLDDRVPLVSDDGEQVGRLPDDREVTPQAVPHREAGSLLRLLLVHRGRQGQAAGDAGATPNERLDGRHHGRQPALHVGCAASVEPPVGERASVRIMRPASARGDGVGVAIEDQMGARPLGSQPGQEVCPSWLDLLELARQAEGAEVLRREGRE
jgi:hypothetical protein